MLQPFVIDSPGQVRIDLGLALTGMPTVEEWRAKQGKEDSLEDRTDELSRNLAFQALQIRLEERGLIGRLLQMGAVFAGKGGKDQLIAEAETLGKPELVKALGQEKANEIVAKVKAFLTNGGKLTVAVKAKAGSLGADALMGMGMQPQAIGNNLDFQLTYSK